MLKKLKEHKEELAIIAAITVSCTVLYIVAGKQANHFYNLGADQTQMRMRMTAASAGLLDQLVDHERLLLAKK